MKISHTLSYNSPLILAWLAQTLFYDLRNAVTFLSTVNVVIMRKWNRQKTLQKAFYSFT